MIVHGHVRRETEHLVDFVATVPPDPREPDDSTRCAAPASGDLLGVQEPEQVHRRRLSVGFDVRAHLRENRGKLSFAHAVTTRRIWLLLERVVAKCSRRLPRTPRIVSCGRVGVALYGRRNAVNGNRKLHTSWSAPLEVDGLGRTFAVQVVAIGAGEPAADRAEKVLRRWAWWSMVLESRHGVDGVRLLDLLIESAGIEVVAVDFAQAKIACRAFADCGKGPRPAGLNYGDCFVYGLAHQLGEQQLTRGENFTYTDLAPDELDVRSQPTQCATLRIWRASGEGRLRLPFGPLADRRVRPPRPEVGRAHLRPLQRAAIVA